MDGSGMSRGQDMCWDSSPFSSRLVGLPQNLKMLMRSMAEWQVSLTLGIWVSLILGIRVSLTLSPGLQMHSQEERAQGAASL